MKHIYALLDKVHEHLDGKHTDLEAGIDAFYDEMWDEVKNLEEPLTPKWLDENGHRWKIEIFHENRYIRPIMYPASVSINFLPHLEAINIIRYVKKRDANNFSAFLPQAITIAQFLSILEMLGIEEKEKENE